MYRRGEFRTTRRTLETAAALTANRCGTVSYCIHKQFFFFMFISSYEYYTICKKKKKYFLNTYILLLLLLLALAHVCVDGTAVRYIIITIYFSGGGASQISQQKMEKKLGRYINIVPTYIYMYYVCICVRERLCIYVILYLPTYIRVLQYYD